MVFTDLRAHLSSDGNLKIVDEVFSSAKPKQIALVRRRVGQNPGINRAQVETWTKQGPDSTILWQRVLQRQIVAHDNNGLHTEPFLGRVSMFCFLYGPGEPGRYLGSVVWFQNSDLSIASLAVVAILPIGRRARIDMTNVNGTVTLAI